MNVKTKECLALHGGRRVREKPMPARMAFGKEELGIITELFKYYEDRHADFGYQGEYEKRYTDDFVRYMGVDGFADAVATGTGALFVALASLQLEQGAHVIVSPVTDPGTISAVILNRLVPVLVDASPDSFNVGVDEFRHRITDKVKAAVIVHSAGKAAPVDIISNIARERGIYIIEDCSQAHGAKINGRKIGSFGEIAAFSTMYRKNHATGGCGGVLFTPHIERYNLIRSYADRGKPFHVNNFDDKDPSSFLFPALNLNIDEISCAIGIKSLEKLDVMIKKRMAFLEKLSRAISENSKICRFAHLSPEDSPFFQPIIVDTSRISCSKVQFAEAVRAEGIDINPDYRYIVSEWKWVKSYLSDDFTCDNAVRFREKSFNLLFNENYGDREVEDIVAALLKVESVYGR